MGISNVEQHILNKMKTAITALQEMMIKIGVTPEYECISQSGPQHLATFEYRCAACGVVVTASARSKKEAKQNVARLMLYQLSLQGHRVPAPFGLPPTSTTQYCPGDKRQNENIVSEDNQDKCPIVKKKPTLNPVELAGAGATDSAGSGPGAEVLQVRSYVALLKELCETFMLPAVEYELVGDTGPPHLRHFTVRARMGLYERCATATTKKAARQIAAEQLYTYLRENMPRITADFDEKEALVRAHEKAMERYSENREDTIRRPDLSQKIAEYHCGLVAQIDAERRAEATRLLRDAVPPAGAERALEAVAAALALAAHWDELETDGGALCTVELIPTSPPLMFAGAERASASAAALRYLRAALRGRPEVALPGRPGPA